MLDYISRIKKVSRMIQPSCCSSKIFRPTFNGVVLSDDFTVDASSFDDYSADKMVASGVNIGSAPVAEDISLNSLDSVEEQSYKIIESEHLILKSENNETEN